MKKLILLELALLFLATTFQSDNPPGWYQQPLPVNDLINDVFFLDRLNGWVVTKGNTSTNDTGYILKTSNGGDNWIIQFSKNVNLNVIQMVDSQIGYVGGGSGSGTRYMYKTTDSGNNWYAILGTFAKGSYVQDLCFINEDTGWYCDNDLFAGGVFKSTNGGISWIQQLNETYKPTKLFFLNKDTGWVNKPTGGSCTLYRTINGGTTWDSQFVFPQQINDILFVNIDNGYISSGRMYKSTNGGTNWIQSQSDVGGIQLTFVSDSIGWAGYSLFNVAKTTTGGRIWFNQTTPTGNNFSVSGLDSLNAWAGGIRLIHTTDGGPTSVIENSNNNVPGNYKLSQNYPNPFNPNTIISYELQVSGYVTLKIYNAIGKQVRALVNGKKYSGEYKIDFDANDLPNGVYFYRIEIQDEKSNEVFTETKKMILLR